MKIGNCKYLLDPINFRNWHTEGDKNLKNVANRALIDFLPEPHVRGEKTTPNPLHEKQT